MKRFVCIATAAAMICSLAACSGNSGGQTPAPTTAAVEEAGTAAGTEAEAGGQAEKLDIKPGDIIGVSLTSRGSERWVRDSESLEKAITEAG